MNAERRPSNQTMISKDVMWGVVIAMLALVGYVAISGSDDDGSTSQSNPAADTVAKADVTNIAKQVQTYYIEFNGLPTVTLTDGHYVVAGKDIGAQSSGVVFGGIVGSGATDWCVWVTNPQGDVAARSGYQYSAQGGLDSGSCDQPIG